MYRATLLPGLDFGDTAAFQDAGGAIEITPRQGYPLYFAIGNLVVWVAGGEPAFGMNLSSAICAALACGLIVWLAADLTGSLFAGVFTGCLFAGSYTFWTQSIIAEVYALHILLLTLSLTAVTWWAKRPTSLLRLAVFFAVYALGFGNHLMMILLFPAVTLFLAVTMPGGTRELLRSRVIALAVLMAALGAVQYAWNLRSLYTAVEPPPAFTDALRTMWFDVTKADWRSTMVMGIDQSAFRPRLAMYWFELRQQFGVAGVAAALLGVLALVGRWRLLLLLVTGWLVAAVFAYTYNVGDTHVFYLPSHLFVALLAGCGVNVLLRAVRPRRAAAAVAALLLAYPVWRIVDDWPAVDRSDDTRAAQLVRTIASGIPSERAVLLADLNWQLQNGLDYYTRHTNPDLLHIRTAGRLLTVPWFIEDNRRNGRDILLTPESARLLEGAFGSTWQVDADPPGPTLAQRAAALPRGTPFVLALLRAYSDVPLDTAELARLVEALTGPTTSFPVDGVYTVMIGRSGAPPVLLRREASPFRLRTTLDGLNFDIRMESWLPPDTIRRAGFGHAIVNRRHVLTLERGVSLVVLDAAGMPRMTGYASGLYAPPARYRIRAHPGV